VHLSDLAKRVVSGIKLLLEAITLYLIHGYLQLQLLHCAHTPKPQFPCFPGTKLQKNCRRRRCFTGTKVQNLAQKTLL
jgi:hypothetical protein